MHATAQHGFGNGALKIRAQEIEQH